MSSDVIICREDRGKGRRSASRQRPVQSGQIGQRQLGLVVPFGAAFGEIDAPALDGMADHGGRAGWIGGGGGQDAAQIHHVMAVHLHSIEAEGFPLGRQRFEGLIAETGPADCSLL